METQDQSRYWELEEPIIARTSGNVLRWYKHAERLQISYPDYRGRGGGIQAGKTVAISIAEVNDEARALIREALGL